MTETAATQRTPSLTATFFVAPYLIAIALAVIAYLVVLVVAMVMTGRVNAEIVYNTFALALIGYLGLALVAATLYVLTHWPFIPLLRRVQDAPLKRRAIVAAGIALLAGAIATPLSIFSEAQAPLFWHLLVGVGIFAASLATTASVLFLARRRARFAATVR